MNPDDDKVSMTRVMFKNIMTRETWLMPPAQKPLKLPLSCEVKNTMTTNHYENILFDHDVQIYITNLQ